MVNKKYDAADRFEAAIEKTEMKARQEYLKRMKLVLDRAIESKEWFTEELLNDPVDDASLVDDSVVSPEVILQRAQAQGALAAHLAGTGDLNGAITAAKAQVTLLTRTDLMVTPELILRQARAQGALAAHLAGAGDPKGAVAAAGTQVALLDHMDLSVKQDLILLRARAQGVLAAHLAGAGDPAAAIIAAKAQIRLLDHPDLAVTQELILLRARAQGALAAHLADAGDPDGAVAAAKAQVNLLDHPDLPATQELIMQRARAQGMLAALLANAGDPEGAVAARAQVTLLDHADLAVTQELILLRARAQDALTAHLASVGDSVSTVTEQPRASNVNTPYRLEELRQKWAALTLAMEKGTLAEHLAVVGDSDGAVITVRAEIALLKDLDATPEVILQQAAAQGALAKYLAVIDDSVGTVTAQPRASNVISSYRLEELRRKRANLTLVMNDSYATHVEYAARAGVRNHDQKVQAGWYLRPGPLKLEGISTHSVDLRWMGEGNPEATDVILFVDGVHIFVKEVLKSDPFSRKLYLDLVAYRDQPVTLDRFETCLEDDGTLRVQLWTKNTD